MRKLLLVLVSLAAVLVGVSAASATPPGSGGYGSGEVVCDRACFDAIFNQGGVPGPVDPGTGGGDNASSICADHGGLYAVQHYPGYGMNGEPVVVTVVTCMDGHQETIGGIKANAPNDPNPPGDGAGDGSGDGAGGGAGDAGSSASPYDWSQQTGEECHERDAYGVCIARGTL